VTLANQLVVFAKAPRLGQVKRRLAAGIGEAAALAFYRRTLADLLRRVAADPRWQTWLAVTPDGAAADPAPWPKRIPRLAQGGGDLGARMARMCRRLPPGPVVIVGSDIPALRAGHVAQAFAALGAHDAVFGPAGDGGYWLVGLRRRPRVPDPFRGVRWSTPHALADTLANLRPRERVAMLERLEDIDDAASYRRWRRQNLAQIASASHSH
jgi:rSAM/selenodomain-associated transferase 1